MNILFVTAEAFPLIKSGGLGDISGALPPALEAEGMQVRVLIPGYPAVVHGLTEQAEIAVLDDLPGGHDGRLLSGRANGLALLVIDVPALYDRPGNAYGDEHGHDWPDNHLRFAVLGWVAAWVAAGGLAAWQPAILHAHDWHAGLAPAYLALRSNPARVGMVMTIHNIAFQGLFPASLLETLRLPPASFAMEGVEFHDQIGFLKAGLYYAHRITTVSPTYAKEIAASPEGCGLEGLIASRAGVLNGILNGIDTDVWNPAADAALPVPYDAQHLAAKAKNKAALQAELGLAIQPEAPLCAVISRLTEQKGIDQVMAAMPRLLDQGIQLTLLGNGNKDLEDDFRAIAAAHAQAVSVIIGYDEPLSHRMQAASDFLLAPSRFEPCGLTQLYALRYGTLPVVAPVGGLADTVIDGETGFWIKGHSPEVLAETIERAAAVWRQPKRRRAMQRAAMAQDFSWHRPARLYRTLYEELLAGL